MIEKNFWRNISQIQNVLLLNDEGVAALLDINISGYLKLKNALKLPYFENVYNLCERLGTTQNSLYEGDVDLIQIRNLYLGNFCELPAKYDYGKLSKSRTIINCLDYVELRYGMGTKLALLRSLNIDPRFFDSPDRDMNLNVLTDLCKQLEILGFTNEDYKNLGRRSYDVNKSTELGHIFSSYKNVYDLFEDICATLSTKFDKNFNYDISKIEGGAIYIQSRPTELAQDLLHTSNVGNNTICQTKLGVFGTFPKYLGYKNSDAIKTKCLYSGDSVLEYKITF